MHGALSGPELTEHMSQAHRATNLAARPAQLARTSATSVHHDACVQCRSRPSWIECGLLSTITIHSFIHSSLSHWPTIEASTLPRTEGNIFTSNQVVVGVNRSQLTTSFARSRRKRRRRRTKMLDAWTIKINCSLIKNGLGHRGTVTLTLIALSYLEFSSNVRGLHLSELDCMNRALQTADTLNWFQTNHWESTHKSASRVDKSTWSTLGYSEQVRESPSWLA